LFAAPTRFLETGRPTLRGFGPAEQNQSRPQQNPSQAQQNPSRAQRNPNWAQQNQNKKLLFFNGLT
jgi:hypothetical protein